MKFNLYENDKTFIGKFDHNSDILTAMNEFCNQHQIKTGSFSIIGAVKKSILGFYNQHTKKYSSLEQYDKPMEIVSKWKYLD